MFRVGIGIFWIGKEELDIREGVDIKWEENIIKEEKSIIKEDLYFEANSWTGIADKFLEFGDALQKEARLELIIIKEYLAQQNDQSDRK